VSLSSKNGGRKQDKADFRVCEFNLALGVRRSRDLIYQVPPMGHLSRANA